MPVHALASRELDQQKYEAYRRYEELTDISERLSAPVETAASFIVDKGLVYANTGDKLMRVAAVVEKGRDEAIEAAKWRPDVAFEARRRQIELEEAFDVEALARGELAGNTVVVISPVPDAVREGNTAISGYNRERLRCMVRIYRRRNSSRIDTVTLSLDQSNYRALQAVVSVMGSEMHDGLGSEEILARRLVLDTDETEMAVLPSVIREAYDRRLGEAIGGDWHAGSRFRTNADALSHIMSHPDLITEHMDAVAEVTGAARSAEERNTILEQLRQRSAAAFDGRLLGRRIVSISDSVVGDMAASGSYSGDCPTSLMDQRAIMAEESSFSVRQCPICGETNVRGKVQHGFVMGSCGCSKEICGDRVFNSKADKAAAKTPGKRSDSVAPAAKPETAPRRGLQPSKQELIRARYGKFAMLRTDIAVGGGKQYIVDRRSDEVLAEL